MTRAASLLCVAQPALGLQIRQLEELLGTALFERHSRGVSVTAAGQLLYDRAATILRLIDEAEREVKSLGADRKETLTVGVTPSIMRLVGSELIAAARRDLPNVFISLVEEPSFVLDGGIERGEIDLGLTYEIARSPLIRRTPMLIEQLLLVTRPDRAPPRQKAIDFEEVLGLELVLAHKRDAIRRLVEAAAHERGLTVKVAYEVQSLQATRRVVLDGLASSILPYGTVADELTSGHLLSLPIRAPRLRRRLYLARPSGRAPFANEAGLMRLMRSVVRQLEIDLEGLAEPCPVPVEEEAAIR